MKRRGFVRALIAAAPAAPALLAQQQQGTQQPGPAQPAPGIPLNPTTPIQPPGRTAAMDLPKLDPSIPDAAADMMPHFFSPPEFSALQKLGDLLMPSTNGRPGASDAKAAEFLDFLIGQSPADRQQVYRAGLDGLNQQSQKRYNKRFADLDPQQSATLLVPLQQPWTYETPSEPIARFLRIAKQDLRTATTNSREYATASSRGGAGARRMAGFGGLYWYPLD